MEVYSMLFDSLTSRGHAVLSYDITGRGYSHSSGAPMTLNHLVQQLEELLSVLQLDDRQLDLVGWSMGGVIASSYAVRHPSRIARLALIAPPGATPPMKPLSAKLLLLPLVGNALAGVFVPSALRSLYARELEHHTDGGRMLAFLCDHATRNRALPRAIISALRDLPELDDHTAVYTALDPSSLPILVVWGTQDDTVDRRAVEALMAQLGAHARLHVVEGERHSLLLTASAKVNPELARFVE
eukprot:Transcript_20252.p1 GENE.Transcript_20252~~Transcript_20252.p1  ORF type:complete len:242 (+),score=57.01 Transcript_20252:1261-1986(+)